MEVLETIHISMTLCLFHSNCSHQLKQVTCGWFQKFWRACLFEESHCSIAFKGTCLLHRTSCNNLFLKGSVLNTQKHLQWFYSNGDCVNSTISQQQLQLFIFFMWDFTYHRTAEEERGHLFTSCLSFPPASQTLRN